MSTHVKVLAWLQVIYAGAMILLGGVALLVFGGLGAFLAMMDPSGVTTAILGAVGGLAFAVLLVLSLPRLAAGIGLLGYRPWARVLTIILCVLGLLEFPFGTAISVYGLWVLLSQEGTVLFQRA